MLGQEVSQLSVGIVCELHPKLLGRMKVRFPHLDNTESDWCAVVAPMAGSDRGMVMLPEVGDHVLVGFEQGAVERGFILGGLWNEKQVAPASDGDVKKNNWRFIRSRAGHIICLDDTKNAERIEIITSDTKQSIVIDVAEKQLDIKSESGDISIQAERGKVTILAKEISLKSQTDLKIEAGGVLTLKGSMVNIN